MPFGINREERTDRRERGISRKEIKVQPYIKNLTENLIGKHCYHRVARELSRRQFVEHIKDDLENDDVRKMNPETLGKIMCALEIGDVMAGKQELFGALHFAGDPGDVLRELVSLCLAYAILGRFDEEWGV